MRVLFILSCLFPTVLPAAAPALGAEVLARAQAQGGAEREINKDSLDTREILHNRNNFYFALRAARDVGQAEVATDDYGNLKVEGPGSVAPLYRGSFRVRLSNGKECVINRDQAAGPAPYLRIAENAPAAFALRCAKPTEE